MAIIRAEVKATRYIRQGPLYNYIRLSGRFRLLIQMHIRLWKGNADA